jgi:site-specific DNA-methyltransferase (adenine-specific)
VWTNFLGKEPILETARAAGYGNLWGEFVWAKRTTDSSGGEQLFRAYEVALVLFQRPAPPPSPADAAVPWASLSGYGDEGEEEKWGNHPHHKPFAALEPLLRTYSKPGDWVLDPFAGSGSIGAAALRLARKAACLELRPEWAQKAQQRLATETATDPS